MRHKEGLPSTRRMAVAAFTAAVAIALLAPMIASAANAKSTLVLGRTYMYKAAPFTISGRMPVKYKGKQIGVEIRKPGRTHWDRVIVKTVASNGRWSTRYTPKLGGKFYVRARYISGKNTLSRTGTITVKKGPGVKTQILLSSTTSTKDSGLFERIGPAFLAACPEYTLKAEFVGSGTALAHGGTGDADVLLTHSPAAEAKFMNGYVASGATWTPSPYRGLTRYKVMYNDFVLVGPTSNPAGVVNNASSGGAAAAFQAVATAGSTFWSRNDGSGTNSKEKAIWAGIGNPQTGKPWYKASGTMGMAQALATANDAGTSGYTLADRATWLNAKSLGIVSNLSILNAGDPTLFNQYAVIEVKGARNTEGAQDFSNWIRSPGAQALIKTYGEYTYPGEVMFEPNAGPYPW
jgi:tungstate transport system substrate-binding protein